MDGDFRTKEGLPKMKQKLATTRTTISSSVIFRS